MKNTTITVTEKTADKLRRLKLSYGFSSIDAVIVSLLKMLKEFKRMQTR